MKDSDKQIIKMFFEAVSQGDLSLVAQIYDDGCSINAVDDLKRTALHHCAIHGYDDISMYLIGKGIVVNARDYFGLTAVHLSCIYNNLEVLNVLLESQSANINGLSKRRFTPLMIASWFNYSEALMALLKNNANTSLLSSDGFGAIHYSALNGSLEALKTFNELGIDLKTTTQKKLDILDIAKICKKDDIVDYLCNELGWTDLNTVAFRAVKISTSTAEDMLPKIEEIADNNDDSNIFNDLSLEEGEDSGTGNYSSTGYNLEKNNYDLTAEDTSEIYENYENKYSNSKKSEESLENLYNTDAYLHYDRNKISYLDGSGFIGSDDKLDDSRTESYYLREAGLDRNSDSEIDKFSYDDVNNYDNYSINDIENNMQNNKLNDEMFENSEYIGDQNIQDESKIHRTVSGGYVSNILELTIFNMLNILDIKYEINRVMYGTVTPGKYTPKLTFFDKNGDVIVWDILGYDPDDIRNKDRWHKTFLWYQKNGFNSGTNFFTSYFNEAEGIDSLEIYNIILEIKDQTK